MPRPRTRFSLTPIARRACVAVIAASALTAASASVATAAERPPVKPIASLDVQRYLGTWRQIAAIPQWYEALCLSNVTANYTLGADGTVGVTNSCAGPLGANVVTRGRARILDQTTKAQLQVTFVPLGSGKWFYPNAEPNYVIVGLGANYDWAVVGDPQRTSGFVLSRTPALTADQTAAVKAALVGTGFNPCRLIVTKQRGGALSSPAFC